MIKSESNINVFNANTTHVTCTVNCQGHMGRGIALYMRKRVPGLYEAYKRQVESGALTVDKLWIYKNSSPAVLCFPTKDKTWEPSKLEWIENNLKKLRDNYKQMGITSIAIPPLGCSNGNLEWGDVRKLIYDILSDCDLEVHICLGEQGIHRKLRVLVAGSRTVTNYKLTENAIELAFSGLRLTKAEREDVVFISGLALEGPDNHAITYCRKNGNRLEGYPAKWNELGKRAGMVRNAEMAKVINYGVVVYDGKSKGTKNMIELLNKHDIDNFIYITDE